MFTDVYPQLLNSVKYRKSVWRGHCMENGEKNQLFSGDNHDPVGLLMPLSGNVPAEYLNARRDLAVAV